MLEQVLGVLIADLGIAQWRLSTLQAHKAAPLLPSILHVLV